MHAPRDMKNFKAVTYEELAKSNGYIYHLLNKDGKIVYVGSTTKIFTRLESHVREATKIFHLAKYWEVNRDDMLEIELEQIMHYNPIYNVTLPINNKYITFDKAKKTNSILKGKSIKIRKIMQNREWEFKRGCLEKEQWIEICQILNGETKHE